MSKPSQMIQPVPVDSANAAPQSSPATDAGTGRHRRAEWLLVVVALIWAFNNIVAKWTLGTVNELVFNALRYPLAFAFIAAAFPLAARWQPVRRSDWRRLLGLGLLGNVLYQSAFIVGLSLTTAGNSAIMFATTPLWTALWSGAIHKEKLRRIVWAGMTLSLLGVALIIIGSSEQIRFGGRGLWGDLITLGAAVLWALNTNMQKRLVTAYPPAQVQLITIGVGAVILPLIAVPSLIHTDWTQLGWRQYTAIVASGALSIGLCYVLWGYAVKKLGPSRTGNYGNLVPVLTFALSYFVLQEHYTVIQLIGAAVALCGIWLARR